MKHIATLEVIAFLALTILTVAAQTVKTNVVEAPGEWRVVDGQLYNTDRSKAWQSFTFEPVRPVEDGMFGYKHTWTVVSLSRPTIETQTPVFVRNLRAATGVNTEIKALPLGTLKVGDNFYQSYDVGKPHTAAIITTNQPTKAETTKTNSP